ncbi:hypothetical protein [Patulibacter americanus]|uniref:hypothetical protein n=1 Tax=Patulibacter americanus TaxID=588672 RepID=UPI0003B4213D|nr:hypothetical protein [Patulibacter americanus]
MLTSDPSIHPARRRLAVVAAAAAIGLTGTGCSNTPSESGGGHGATATGSSAGGSTFGSPSTSGRDKAVRFSGCMRDNGVRDFPDPDASGELTLDGVVNGSSLDADSAAWKAAIATCKDLQPSGFAGRKRGTAQQEAALAFARCMRENGVRDFPDPTEGGALIDTTRIPSAKGRGALEIPGFQAAQDACEKHAATALEGQ